MPNSSAKLLTIGFICGVWLFIVNTSEHIFLKFMKMKNFFNFQQFIEKNRFFFIHIDEEERRGTKHEILTKVDLQKYYFFLPYLVYSLLLQSLAR